MPQDRKMWSPTTWITCLVVCLKLNRLNGVRRRRLTRTRVLCWVNLPTRLVVLGVGKVFRLKCRMLKRSRLWVKVVRLVLIREGLNGVILFIRVVELVLRPRTISRRLIVMLLRILTMRRRLWVGNMRVKLVSGLTRRRTRLTRGLKVIKRFLSPWVGSSSARRLFVFRLMICRRRRLMSSLVILILRWLRVLRSPLRRLFVVVVLRRRLCIILFLQRITWFVLLLLCRVKLVKRILRWNRVDSGNPGHRTTWKHPAHPHDTPKIIDEH